MLAIKHVVVPSALACVPNGCLTSQQLTDVGHGGRLHDTAARAWSALWLFAMDEETALTWTWGGLYRTLAQQEALFYERWTTAPQSGPSTQYGGQHWWLRPGVARAAVPGTSNHGLGLAIDMALGDQPAHAQPVGPALPWLASTLPDFGFFWESQSEPWHVNYVLGDAVPTLVEVVEARHR